MRARELAYFGLSQAFWGCNLRLAMNPVAE